MVERGELDRGRDEFPGLIRPPLLDTPAGALNRAFAWAVRRDPAGVRADPGDPIDWGSEELEDLLESAESFRRVGPQAAPDPADFLRRVISGLFGVHADGAGGRYQAMPWIPESWKAMALRRLRCHRTILDLEVRPRAEWVTVRLEASFGPPIPLAVGIRNRGPIAQVTVDETPVGGELAIFTLSGRHELTFFPGAGNRSGPDSD